MGSQPTPKAKLRRAALKKGRSPWRTASVGGSALCRVDKIHPLAVAKNLHPTCNPIQKFWISWDDVRFHPKVHSDQ